MTWTRSVAAAVGLSVLLVAPAAPAAADPNPSVGDTIHVSGLNSEQIDVTLTKISDPTHAAGYNPGPSSGDRLIGVQVRIANSGSDVYSDAPDTDVTVVDAKGQSYSSNFDDITAGPSFPGSVNIPAGDSRLGYVAFEIPSSATVTEVQFSADSGTADDVGTWSVPATPKATATSDGGAVVVAFYDAINNADYRKAWELGGKNLGGSYDTFAAGFDNTQHDVITIGTTDGDVVHVDLSAQMVDGSLQNWTGTYTVRDGVIVAGHLRRS